jgi:SAM-dependent methyltransferase
MEHWDSLTFGRRHAADYDDQTRRSDTPATVEALERLADGGPVLELAIGTGRVALPLAARGLRVDGVDISPEMVAQLRAKPGGDELAVTIGDMADVPVTGEYRLVYIVFNTLFNLVTQDAQVRCFQNVATHLTDGGCFVIEAFVPSSLVRLRDHQYVDAEVVTVDEVRLDVGRHDAIAQRLDESHVRITEHGIRLYPVVTRYAWPAELDLMARIAGLRLEQRWAGWSDEPFTADSQNHVSVYRR